MPIFKLNTVHYFSSSHFLPHYHGKCEKLHGHNYKLIVTIEGAEKKDGMVFDYKEIKKIVEDKVISYLDHNHLNDIVKNPSSENMCVWIWKKLKKYLPVKKIILYETENYFCEYQGEA